MRIPVKPVTYRESAPARVGEMIFRREGCLSCHALFGNGTGYGPALDGVGSRRDGLWLKKYLRSPRRAPAIDPTGCACPPTIRWRRGSWTP